MLLLVVQLHDLRYRTARYSLTFVEGTLASLANLKQWNEIAHYPQGDHDSVSRVHLEELNAVNLLNQ